MRVTKRLIMFILVFSMVICSSFEGTPLVANAADTTYTWGSFWGWVPPTSADSTVAKYISEKTGVKFSDIYAVQTDQTQQLMIKMASGGLPDVITTTPGDYQPQRLVEAKALMPLDKYFEDPTNYPGLASINPMIRQRYTFPDGHIYFVPNNYFMDMNNVPYMNIAYGLRGWKVRSDILKNVGMKTSDLTTFSGIEKFLLKAKALKTKDGKPIIPLTIFQSNLSDALPTIYASYGVQEWNKTSKGWIPYWQTSGFKSSLAWLNKMYLKGLLDAETCTQKVDQYSEKAVTARFAMNIGHGEGLSNSRASSGATTDAFMAAASKDPKYNLSHVDTMGWVEIPYPVVPGYKVVTPAQNMINPFGYIGTALKKGIEDPDKVMKFIDYLCTAEGATIAANGIPGKGLSISGDKITPNADEIGKFWGGFPGTVKTEGIWYFGWMAGPAPQNPLSQRIFNGKTLQANYQPAENRRYIYNYVVQKKQGTVSMAPSWTWMELPQNGVTSKSSAIQGDIIKNYQARLIMAKTTSDFEATYKKFLDEMVKKGNSAKTIKEWNDTYNVFIKTPSGKTVLTWPRNITGLVFQPTVEKNVPGIWYGTQADLSTK